MKPNGAEPPSHKRDTTAGDPAHRLDQVRDLLFGENTRLIEARLATLEKLVKKQHDQHARAEEAHAARADKSKAQIDDLTKRLRLVERDKSDRRELARQLRDLAKGLEDGASDR